MCDSPRYVLQMRFLRISSLRFLLIGVCTLLYLFGSAQQRVLNFTNITTEQGLSENTVLDIIQDQYGFMWFATENGLTKFDGLNYTVYRKDNQDSTSIPNDEIQSLCVHGDELFIASVYPTVIMALNLKTDKFRIILKFDQIEDLEKAYFLKNNNYTLLITQNEKYIYNAQKGQFEVFNALNKVLKEIETTSKPQHNNTFKLPQELERLSLDADDKLIGFTPTIGIFEIDLPGLDYKTLFSYEEFLELYSFEKKEELTEVFIFRDSEKRIWFNINNNGLGFFHHISRTYHPKFQNIYVKDIFEDGDNNIWFASESGVLFFDSANDHMRHFTHNPLQKYGLSNNYISSVFINDQEVLWLGHDGGGVDYARYYNIKNFLHLDAQTENALLSNRITGISESINNEIWISTDKGINKWKKNKEGITYYLKDILVKSIFCDSEGNVWCIDENNKILCKRANTDHFEILQFKESKHEFGDQVGTPALFFEDSRNRLWLIGNGLFYVNYEELELIKNEVCPEINFASSIKEDKKGNFWITGNTGQLIVMNPDLKKYHLYNYDIDNPYSLNSNILWDVHVDKYENLWIATNEGINKTNIGDYSIGEPLIFESYTQKEGLYDEIVFRIFEDDGDNLWFATNNGLSKMKTMQDTAFPKRNQSTKFINYFTLDGIASNSIGSYTDNHVTYLCGAKLRSGEILLGSDNGITTYNPTVFYKNVLFPTVLFTDFKISNRSVPIGNYGNRVILTQNIFVTDSIELSYRDKVFSFEFILLDYSDPNKNQYEYLLEGFDDEWIFLGNQNMANFTSIPGGSYTLKIRAANNEGFWNNNETSIKITIIPPFYQNSWFIILLIMFAFGSFILFYYYRINQIKSQKIKLENLVKERTKEIELKNEQLKDQTEKLNDTNIELEEKTKALENQSEELRVINNRLLKQKNELELLNKEVRSANQAKLNFYTNISHELRTPLTLIIGPLESLLHKEKLSGYAKDQLDMMHRNSNRLLNLINQLLDFRKLETENMKLTVAEGDIIRYLKEIYALFKNLAKKNNISYTFNSQINELIILFDSDKVEKIVSNLLSNAFKYTPSGGKVEISLSLTESHKSQSKFQIAISDTGIGISQDKISHVFERYYSASDLNMNVTSTGIGLALTKELVELHKGSISVISQVSSENNTKGGSKFIVELPISRSSYHKNERIQINGAYKTLLNHKMDITSDVETLGTQLANLPKESNENDNRPAVLIVEDNKDMNSFIKSILMKYFRTISAKNGKEAIEILQDNSFSLIISDVMMPEINGIDFCKYVKDNIKSSHIPVILLTAKTDTESQIAGLRTGADDYITKPFNSKILIEKINNLILIRKRLWEKFNKQIVFTPEDLTPNTLDVKLLANIKKVVERHISNPELDVSLFAQEVGMSKSILYEKLKSLTGKTINEFISSIRLKKAAKLILEGELNISEISLEVGYMDPNYFSKAFKKHFGVVPSKFNDQSSFVRSYLRAERIP